MLKQKKMTNFDIMNVAEVEKYLQKCGVRGSFSKRIFENMVSGYRTRLQLKSVLQT